MKKTGRNPKSEKTYIDFENRIYECRQNEGKGMTQTALAKELHISKATMNNYEHQKPYTRDIAQSLADLFQVDVQYFTYESNYKNSNERMRDIVRRVKENRLKFETLLEWLSANGYKLEQTNYTLDGNTEIKADNKTITNIIHTDKEIYILTKPDGTKRYLTEENLNIFVDIMLSTLDRLTLPYKE